MDKCYYLFPKSLPLNKPLSFNGNQYIYWKQKIGDFIKVTNIDMWDIIEIGYKLLKILIDVVYQPKVKSLWIEKEKKKYLLTSKVK